MYMVSERAWKPNVAKLLMVRKQISLLLMLCDPFLSGKIAFPDPEIFFCVDLAVKCIARFRRFNFSQNVSVLKPHLKPESCSTFFLEKALFIYTTDKDVVDVVCIKYNVGHSL